MMKAKTEVGNEKIRIGISTCLLGMKVRFDAGHKRDYYITDTLGNFFDFVAICPELEVGMGVPREAVRLEDSGGALRMVGGKTGADWTKQMTDYAQARLQKRDLRQISGYILKKGSPSCGMERVKVYGASGAPRKDGVGLYAAQLLTQFPLLPVEEEGRLHDIPIRENFIERVFAYHRLQSLFGTGYSRGRLVQFHTMHKYLLLAHSPKHYDRLGALVAEVKKHPHDDFRRQYSALFMGALAIKSSIRKNINVLQHIMGFFKNNLDADDKQYLLAVMEDYRQGLVPLVVPITLIKNYVRKFEVNYIADQIYLNPHPKELMLRNHV